MPLLTQTAQQVSAVAGKATVSIDAGIITSESLVTAAGATYTLTVGCDEADAGSIVLASIQNGTNNAGDPSLGVVDPANNNTIVFTVVNRHATNAFNGTIIISFVVFN
jgi:hypothetical protein